MEHLASTDVRHQPWVQILHSLWLLTLPTPDLFPLGHSKLSPGTASNKYLGSSFMVKFMTGSQMYLAYQPGTCCVSLGHFLKLSCLSLSVK